MIKEHLNVEERIAISLLIDGISPCASLSRDDNSTTVEMTYAKKGPLTSSGRQVLCKPNRRSSERRDESLLSIFAESRQRSTIVKGSAM